MKKFIYLQLIITLALSTLFISLPIASADPGDFDVNGRSLLMDADGNTYFDGSTNDQIELVVGGVSVGTWTAAGWGGLLGTIDLNGNSLIIDTDGDTLLKEFSDDIITIDIGPIPNNFKFYLDHFRVGDTSNTTTSQIELTTISDQWTIEAVNGSNLRFVADGGGGAPLQIVHSSGEVEILATLDLNTFDILNIGSAGNDITSTGVFFDTAIKTDAHVWLEDTNNHVNLSICDACQSTSAQDGYISGTPYTNGNREPLLIGYRTNSGESTIIEIGGQGQHLTGVMTGVNGTSGVNLANSIKFYVGAANTEATSAVTPALSLTTSALVKGHGTNVSTASTPQVQVLGTDLNTSSLLLYRSTAGTGAPVLQFAKTRHGSIGFFTFAQANDTLGAISYYAADGTAADLASRSAEVSVEASLTHTNNDTPARYVISTTKDGNSSPSTGLVITDEQAVLIGGEQTSPSATCIQGFHCKLDLSGSGANGGGQLSLTGLDSAVTDGEVLGQITFGGNDGNTNNAGRTALIQAKAQGDWDAGNKAPTELEFWTNDDASGANTLNQAAEFNKDQQLDMINNDVVNMGNAFNDITTTNASFGSEAGGTWLEYDEVYPASGSYGPVFIVHDKSVANGATTMITLSQTGTGEAGVVEVSVTYNENGKYGTATRQCLWNTKSFPDVAYVTANTQTKADDGTTTPTITCTSSGGTNIEFKFNHGSAVSNVARMSLRGYVNSLTQSDVTKN